MSGELVTNSDKVYYGFTAQDVRENLPMMVTEDEDGYLWYNPSGFEAILTKAVQEQQGSIENLGDRLSGHGLKLKTDVENLCTLGEELVGLEGKVGSLSKLVRSQGVEIDSLRKALEDQLAEADPQDLSKILKKNQEQDERLKNLERTGEQGGDIESLKDDMQALREALENLGTDGVTPELTSILERIQAYEAETQQQNATIEELQAENQEQSAQIQQQNAQIEQLRQLINSK